MSDDRVDSLGDRIMRTVDDAVNRGDYRHLSSSINNIVEPYREAVQRWTDNVERTIEPYRDAVRSRVMKHTGDTAYRTWTPPTAQTGTRAAAGSRTVRRGRKTSYDASSTQRTAQPGYTPGQGLYDRHPVGRGSAVAMCLLGYIFAIAFGITALCCCLALILSGIGAALMASTIVFAGLTAVFVVMAVTGTRRFRFGKRFTEYTRVIGQRVNIPLTELANRVHRPVEAVADDLEQMIAKRMFYQAHLDPDRRFIVMTDRAFGEYMAAKEQYDRRQQEQAEARAMEEARTKADARRYDELTPECRRLIEEGQSYIRYIHESNLRIPGADMTAKLDHMERIITRIFETLRLHPEVEKDLKKLMNYYLPTTKKLLDVYQEMDHQPVAGENISSTKREIEEAVGTLNDAFEKLLDGLYESRAWDVTSDISVLNTVLAQDGLKSDGLHGDR